MAKFKSPGNRVIFMHLPKCGGTTFHRILERMYPSDDIFNIHNGIDKNLLSLAQKKRDEIKLLKGHMLFGLHEHFSGRSNYITFLRKPEERIVSYYYYVIRKPNHRLYSKVVNSGMGLYDFVATINQGDVNNGQIRMISGIHDTESNMLEKAISNIEKHFSFVGTLEDFDESLIILSKIYHWSLPYYRVNNKTRHRRKIDLIDDRTIEAINRFNNGDNELYKIVKSKLDGIIKQHKGLNYQLTKLKLYNQLYSSNAFRKSYSHLLKFFQ